MVVCGVDFPASQISGNEWIYDPADTTPAFMWPTGEFVPSLLYARSPVQPQSCNSVSPNPMVVNYAVIGTVASAVTVETATDN